MARAINIWNRLEGRARKQEFSRALKCEIRDPLWMLTRQWQMGEFKAEDNGSPIKASVAWDTAPLQRRSLKNGKAKAMNMESVPLEAEVERIKAPLDLQLRLEMGRHWAKMLKTNSMSSFVNAFKSTFSFTLPSRDTFEEKHRNAAILNQKKVLQVLHAAVQAGALDGGALYHELIKSNAKASQLIGENNTDLDAMGLSFVKWFNDRYSQPDKNDCAWHPSHLEYQFDCSLVDVDDNNKVFRAKEYYQGRLDWYTFDHAGNESVESSLTEGLTKQSTAHKLTFIPTEVEFPGIPKSRWWEFEDGKVNLANLTVNKEDSGKLVFTQFSLLYSNDWAVVPINIPVNSLTKIKNIVVTDVFGQQTLINHYGDQKANQPWSFFNIHHSQASQTDSKDPYLLIPPVVNNLLEGKPIASVALVRDEMANMVWGVENIIPDELGQGQNGYEAAISIQQYFEQLVKDKDTANEEMGIPAPLTSLVENEAMINYMIGNTVPENWIPFIAVRQKDTGNRQIQLQRAAMPRLVKHFDPQRVRPRTPLLRMNLDHESASDKRYFIFEEEVPRSGALVNLSWQRARWYDGRVVLWLGYRKTNGRGEGNSGLRFDQIVAKK